MEPKIGELFCGRYRLDALLGRGGFSRVFDALDLPGGRNVALKILTPNRDGSYDPAVAARFQREVEIAASLASVHTVTMFDCGVSPEGLRFMVMERLGGEDLSKLLARRGRLNQAEVRSVLLQVCDSLDEAHRAGLLHRDLKPGNIRVVSEAGLTVKLLDFGLARATDNGAPSITSTGELIGTPRYMSPEQLRGQPLSAASDIYTLGIIAHEMLVGASLHSSNALLDQVARIVDSDAVRIPDELGIDPAFVRLIHRMTANDPHSRPQTARAVLNILAESASPGAQPAERRAPPPSRRGILIAATCGAVILGGVVILTYTSDNHETPRPVVENRVSGAALTTLAVAEPAVAREETTTDVGALAVPKGGCGREPSFVGRGMLQNGTRRWLTYVPSKYDPAQPHPLVVLLHEGAQPPNVLLDGARFDVLADRENFVVVAPRDPDEGLFSTWDRASSTVDIVQSVVESTRGQLCIDPERIFVAGQGAGGGAALRLACEEWVRGIATHAHLLSVGRTRLCEGPAVPYLLLAPTQSRVNPFDGGETCTPGTHKVSAEVMTDTFLAHNGCSGGPTTVRNDKSGICRSWDCTTPFEVCHTNGGQPWPGTQRDALSGACDGAPSTFPVTEAVWEFFARQGEKQPADRSP